MPSRSCSRIAKLRDAPVLGGVNAQGDPILSDIYTKNLPEVHGVMRRLRAMIDTYPGERVLIGETYLAKTADLDAWYGGARHDELQLPMDTLVGPGQPARCQHFPRRSAGESQTELHDSQPLLVFDNHDNVRSWNRFGDGVHDAQIARIVAALLLTSRDTALMYQGAGDRPANRDAARASRMCAIRIGITRLAAEKGRDGERTPMQWDASNAQAGLQHQPADLAAGDRRTTAPSTCRARPPSRSRCSTGTAG